MEHHSAEHAGHKVSDVVSLADAMDNDTLEVLRAAAAGQAQIGFHGGRWQTVLDGCTVFPMNRDADNLVDVQWLARCANRLRQEWPRADVTSIEEAALELWGAQKLRELPGDEAAAIWLEPLHCGCGCDRGCS